MKTFLAIVLVTAVAVNAQQQGDQNPKEVRRQMPMQECTSSGSCSRLDTTVVLDANWRWTHQVGTYTNCYTGNQWDTSLCPDPTTCTQNCALEWLKETEWTGTYGIEADGSGMLSLKFVTDGPYSKNIGSRVFLMEGNQYKQFQLLNREFTFTVNDNELDCGINGALYFVEMDPDGGMSYPGNNAGAELGTGYCDAQCPHDIKFMNGEANVLDWTASPDDPNAGFGKWGMCCQEMDIWEANAKAQAYTSHPCDVTEATRCEDPVTCGDNASDNRYDGLCDKDGCDFASYRLGDHEYWGDNGQKIDSQQDVTVVTQFITNDGTDNGQLQEIRRFYIQNGQVIENSKVMFSEVDPYDSISDDFCQDTKQLFGDFDDHSEKGGLIQMGEALARGMTLVMSLWDDHDAHMLWLDSCYPTDAPEDQPGVCRGPCDRDSGDPGDVEATYPNAHVRFSDIRFGPIGSTTKDLIY